jgi:hypothetical protein
MYPSHTFLPLHGTPFAFKSRAISKEDYCGFTCRPTVHAERLLETLANQIKVNEFVPSDMIISVSPVTISLHGLFFSSQLQRKETHIAGLFTLLAETVLMVFCDEFNLSSLYKF